MKLFYEPQGAYFGDCMPFYHDGKFYVFHQRDKRDPQPFEPFEWSLATTTDFIHYEDMGVAIPKEGEDDPEQYIFAGSVFEGEGKFHAIYTAYNRNYAEQGKDAQVLMSAVSDDLLKWEKNGKFVLPAPEGYDGNDWRDPFILWEEESQQYIMILGARKIDKKKVRTGRTVWFTSKNLNEWKFEGDFWAPDLFSMHEMPDLFKMGDWWYLLTTEYSERSKTVYRMSHSLNGPWSAPIDDAFDGRAYYAARSCSSQIEMKTLDSLQEHFITNVSENFYMIEMDIAFSEHTRMFGIRLCEDAETGDAYKFEANLAENRIYFDRTPNQPWYRYFDKGLERPLYLKPNQRYHIRVIVDDTIAVIYIDGVALTTRMYAKAGQGVNVYVVDGNLTVDNIKITK